jgi:hypothetical protein
MSTVTFSLRVDDIAVQPDTNGPVTCAIMDQSMAVNNLIYLIGFAIGWMRQDSTTHGDMWICTSILTPNEQRVVGRYMHMAMQYMHVRTRHPDLLHYDPNGQVITIHRDESRDL